MVEAHDYGIDSDAVSVAEEDSTARDPLDAAQWETRVCRKSGVDPYDYDGDEAVCDVNLLPRVEFTDIKDYLVHGTSFVTREDLKAYKSMEAHNYVTSGWVQQPRVRDLGDGRCVVVGNVRHSQAFCDKPFEPWLLAKEDGEIVNAHCTCKAGLGEACSHIAALLFYIEVVVRMRDGKACTDEENAWLPPYVRHLEGKRCSDVDFASARAKKAILTNLHKDEAPGTDAALREHCTEVMRTLTIEPQVATLVEAETKEQAKSTKWFAFRAGRITASNAKVVCRTSITSPSLSLRKKICYPQDTRFWSPQTAWGRDREEVARRAYTSASASIHVNFKCVVSGLQISQEQPFLAATPDGLISCTCCGDGVLEIKCPYNGRDKTVGELAMTQSACIVLQGGKLRLRTDHAYYYQVQLQMFVCKKTYCDVVVWTTKDFVTLRVYKVSSLCKSMVQRCQLYFECVVLPELCFSHWTNRGSCDTSEEEAQDSEPPTDVLYCVCRKPESGKMIRCDSGSCKFKWFHFDCVNLQRAPRAKKWYCAECKELMSKV
ncbi:hypothetical protein HPB49_004137 [Dermacentor silvarum]|uniref:Uncharacterized protein n=1 Tax=Dermacentor silvarum TaxID=543639 RepID=A0ACB8D2S5_DERSI|nr:hypothetical protein HPB49_004137 [Dermacentor silvarum]